MFETPRLEGVQWFAFFLGFLPRFKIRSPIYELNHSRVRLGAQKRHGKEQHQLGVAKTIQEYPVRPKEEKPSAAPAFPGIVPELLNIRAGVSYPSCEIEIEIPESQRQPGGHAQLRHMNFRPVMSDLQFGSTRKLVGLDTDQPYDSPISREFVGANDPFDGEPLDRIVEDSDPYLEIAA